MKPILIALVSALCIAPTLNPGTASAASKGCPPGLAKKGNGCNPPGQVKNKSPERSHRNDVKTRRVGDVWQGDDRWITNFDRYRIQPRDGYRYVRSGEQVYVIDQTTRQILDILSLARILIN